MSPTIVIPREVQNDIKRREAAAGDRTGPPARSLRDALERRPLPVYAECEAAGCDVKVAPRFRLAPDRFHCSQHRSGA